MIAMLVAAALAAAPAAWAPPPGEQCGVIYTDAAGKSLTKAIPGLRVAGTDEKTFHLPVVTEGKLIALMCGRGSIIPDSSDWIVLQSGVAFMIFVGDRSLWLELDHGRLQVRFTDGQLKPEEVSSMQVRINELQLKLDEHRTESPDPPKK